MGVAVGFGSSSSINGSDEMLGCKSLPLSHVRSIEDGALKFCHVACEGKASPDCVHPLNVAMCLSNSIERI